MSNPMDIENLAKAASEQLKEVLSRDIIVQQQARIEQLAATNGELEAKLQATVEDKIDVVLELTYLQAHLKDFFVLLEITEQKEDGRYFHPNIIRSSRALDAEKLKTILAELKRSITANDKSDG